MRLWDVPPFTFLAARPPPPPAALFIHHLPRQVHWDVSDEMNASVQHNNDPVVRSSLAKAGTVIANAITSPRKVNGLKKP